MTRKHAKKDNANADPKPATQCNVAILGKHEFKCLLRCNDSQSTHSTIHKAAVTVESAMRAGVENKAPVVGAVLDAAGWVGRRKDLQLCDKFNICNPHIQLYHYSCCRAEDCSNIKACLVASNLRNAHSAY